MYDNSKLAVRCRALWADVLCAVEARVFSVNEYVKNPRSRLECHMINGDAVEIDQPAVLRRLVATLDLNEHSIQVNEFQEETPVASTKLPLAMLADGDVYVTSGLSLLGDAMAVARHLITLLLSSPTEQALEPDVDQFRSWATALITVRPPRTAIQLPIEIQTETALYPASTLDLSEVGVKVQSNADLGRGHYVTVFRGTLGSFFRVVWTEKTQDGTRAGLVCLNPPLEWTAQP